MSIITKIKRDRIYNKVNEILGTCSVVHQFEDSFGFIFNMGFDSTIAFCMFGDEIDYLDYDKFIYFGMDKSIVKEELEKIIYERFKYNKIQ